MGKLSREQKKLEKEAREEQKNLETVSEGIERIKEARENLESLVSQYLTWSAEAAFRGEDAYADELLEEQLELTEFIGVLQGLEAKVKNDAVTAKTFNDLKNLPDAVSACKSLLAKSPDFSTLSKDMIELRGRRNEALNSLKKSVSELSKNKNGKGSVFSEIFSSKEDAKRNEKLAALKLQRDSQVARMAAQKDNISATADEKSNFNVSSLDSLIEEENKKN